MAYIILEDCTGCDRCVDDCPNEAITEGDEIYLIDPNKCTECVGANEESQCVAVCPSLAIELDPNYQESQEELLAKYNALHAA